MASSIMGIDELVKFGKGLYSKRFNESPSHCSFAPGRVNLIGEHTDYNDGFVLPMALPLGTLVVGRKNDTNQYIIATSMEMKGSAEPNEVKLNTDDELKKGNVRWANYVIGTLANFRCSEKIPGFNMMIISTVPIGGGLSSSAALEVAVYTFLEGLTNKPNENLVDKALACQMAEHNFAGMPCGIMDQFISVMGKEGCALLIDCRSKEASTVPMNNPDIVILVTNSNVHHELTGSEYPLRRSQCKEAAQLLGKESLRDCCLEDLEALQKNGVSDEVFRRARHVIGEIKRTVDGAEALRNNEFDKFGHLMYESHYSLRDDFEVSCPELDELVEAAKEIDGVLGSRMTGGGFGGCTVTLVHNYAVKDVIANMQKKYSKTATFYVVRPSPGAVIIN